MVTFRFVNADGAARVVDQAEHRRAGGIGGRDHVESERLQYPQHGALAAVFGSVQGEIGIGRKQRIEVRANRPQGQNAALHRRPEIHVGRE